MQCRRCGSHLRSERQRPAGVQDADEGDLEGGGEEVELEQLPAGAGQSQDGGHAAPRQRPAQPPRQRAGVPRGRAAPHHLQAEVVGQRHLPGAAPGAGTGGSGQRGAEPGAGGRGRQQRPKAHGGSGAGTEAGAGGSRDTAGLRVSPRHPQSHGQQPERPQPLHASRTGPAALRSAGGGSGYGQGRPAGSRRGLPLPG